MLESDRETDATATIQALFKYLRSDQNGRRAHTIMTNDPAKIFDWFADDERIDHRYRQNNLATMRRKIIERRTARGKIQAVFQASDRKTTRLNSSQQCSNRMPFSARHKKQNQTTPIS